MQLKVIRFGDFPTKKIPLPCYITGTCFFIDIVLNTEKGTGFLEVCSNGLLFCFASSAWQLICLIL